MKKPKPLPFVKTPLFAQVASRIAKLLDGYMWCLIGGRAVELWSNPPQTPDIDILVEAKSDNRNVRDALSQEFSFLHSLSAPGYSPIRFYQTKTKPFVDVDIVVGFEDVHTWALERAVMVAAPARRSFKFPVATAEDVVILKASAALSPRREDKAQRDIAAIKAIASAVSLDADYIETVLSMAALDYSGERKLLRKLGVLEP